jgi:hypothetical protein
MPPPILYRCRECALLQLELREEDVARLQERNAYLEAQLKLETNGRSAARRFAMYPSVM